MPLTTPVDTPLVAGGVVVTLPGISIVAPALITLGLVMDGLASIIFLTVVLLAAAIAERVSPFLILYAISSPHFQ